MLNLLIKSFHKKIEPLLCHQWYFFKQHPVVKNQIYLPSIKNIKIIATAEKGKTW